MKESVIVLNCDYSPINLVDWQRALQLVFANKASVITSSDTIIKNVDASYQFNIPKVIKLNRYVKGTHTAKVSFAKRNIMTRDKNTCVYCGSTEHPTIDHIIPTSREGESSWFNCVVACHPCNMKKANKTPKESGMALRYKPYHPNLSQWLNIKIDLLGLTDDNSSLYS